MKLRKKQNKIVVSTKKLLTIKTLSNLNPFTERSAANVF
jgi:hypothetical protein